MHQSHEIATLGGGCFWCLEAIFSELRGVMNVISGYSGGNVPNPTYQNVCTGATGYAEVIQVTFDPVIISFKELLEVFFSIHDPTTRNRQGADMGTQYRSVIFYHTIEQEKAAREIIEQIDEAKIWGAQIVTELTPFTEFYPAEEYHQEYLKRNLDKMYCQAVIAPKLSKFHKQYFMKLKKG
ncbi:MAG TPA: peptide-methionine (S)-S-oxide reductase MsrA [Candidatus Methanoperedens sp.]|nr:peptide-methionine (S)-S-oxide reductase MsrA [Candidatus Methanoperedens sp.]